MMLSAMRLGYTRGDLLTVSYSEVAWAIAAVAADEKASGDTREATQEDIRRMLA